MSSEGHHYGLSAAAVSRYRVIGTILLVIGLAILAFVLTAWYAPQIWSGWIGPMVADASGVITLGTQLMITMLGIWPPVILLLAGAGMFQAATRAAGSAYGFQVGPEGLTVRSFSTDHRVTWNRVTAASVSGPAHAPQELVLTCTGTMLGQELGEEQAAKREKQLRDVLHPRVSVGDGIERIRFAPLGALEEPAAMIEDIARHVEVSRV